MEISSSDFAFEDATEGKTGTWAPSPETGGRWMLIPNGEGTVALTQTVDISAYRGTTVHLRVWANRYSAADSSRARLIARAAGGEVLAESEWLEIPGYDAPLGSSAALYMIDGLYLLPISVPSDAATLEIRFESEDKNGLYVGGMSLAPYFEDREVALPDGWSGATTVAAPEGCDVGPAQIAEEAEQKLCATRFEATGARLHVRYRTTSHDAALRVWGRAAHNSWDVGSGNLPSSSSFRTAEIDTGIGCGWGYVVTIRSTGGAVEVDSLWVTAR